MVVISPKVAFSRSTVDDSKESGEFIPVGSIVSL